MIDYRNDRFVVFNNDFEIVEEFPYSYDLEYPKILHYEENKIAVLQEQLLDIFTFIVSNQKLLHLYQLVVLILNFQALRLFYISS
jgi:hypothetical protein